MAQALVEDLRQHFAAAQGLAGFPVDLVGSCHCCWVRIACLVGQRLSKEVLPQVADAAQCLGVVPVEVVNKRQITERCVLNV
ncbi:hypothetical protein D3C86_1625220 [compost metagenome]